MVAIFGLRNVSNVDLQGRHKAQGFQSQARLWKPSKLSALTTVRVLGFTSVFLSLSEFEFGIRNPVI